MITIEEALYLVDNAIEPERLNSIQELILTQCWSGKTYLKIAEVSGYDSDYVRVVGSKLWKLLSLAFGEKITKNNFRSILRQKAKTTVVKSSIDRNTTPFELPNTPVPLNSALYVQRPVEIEAHREIAKPGALIAIKGAKQMGKTSLTMRISAFAKSQNYHIVRLNLFLAEDSVLNNLERLLRWFCTNVALQLGIKPSLCDYWNEDLGYKVSCTNYLQEHILSQLENPLVIILDEIHRLFDRTQISCEFLPLLRFWHEEGSNTPLWQKLRLVISYCTDTETCIRLNTYQSPFNVGLPIVLEEFSYEQVIELANRYKLDCTHPTIKSEQIKTLTQMTGGHPYLINLTFYHLVAKNADIERILCEAVTNTGIYRDHLRDRLVTLNYFPKLASAYKQVVQSLEAVTLDTIIAYELESMGLVKLIDNQTVPRCQLYKLYFRDRLR